MKVRAKKLGYYNSRRQKPGMTFFLKQKEDFSDKWMEMIDEAAKPAKKKVSKKTSKKVEEVSKEIDSNSDVI